MMASAQVVETPTTVLLRTPVTQMIFFNHGTEILALSLAENGVIFRYNHLRRGDYSGKTKFQNGRLALCQCV